MEPHVEHFFLPKPTTDSPRTGNIGRIKPACLEYQKHDNISVLTTVRETKTAA